MQTSTCDVTSCFLCHACMPAWKELISIRKETLNIRKGEQIFMEGQPVAGIYFLYSGAVKVHKQWGDQKELIVRFAGPGDVLGHRGIGGDSQYPVSATALNAVRVCFITTDFLEASLQATPGLTHKLMLLYAAELQVAEKRMRNLAHMDVKGRIAEALLDMIALFGTDDDGYLSVNISRQDVASYAGTTYETVFKFFTELIKDGVLLTDGKRMRIEDQQRLRGYSGGNL